MLFGKAKEILDSYSYFNDRFCWKTVNAVTMHKLSQLQYHFIQINA